MSSMFKRLAALGLVSVALANFSLGAPASAMWLIHKHKKAGAPVPESEEAPEEKASPDKADDAQPEGKAEAKSDAKTENDGQIDMSEGDGEEEKKEEADSTPHLDLSRTEFPTAEDAPHGHAAIPDNGGIPDLSAKNPSLYYELAKKLTEEKRYKEALDAINKALVLNSHYWDAIYQGAYILQLAGREGDAVKHYKLLLSRKPDYVSARVNLGILLKKEQKYVEAEEQFRKAIDINFYSLEPHYDLANVYIQEGKLEEALHELKACLKLAPSNAWVHNNLGVIYQRRNYLEEAEEEFLRALNLEPANKTFENNLSMVRNLLKKKPTRA